MHEQDTSTAQRTFGRWLWDTGAQPPGAVHRPGGAWSGEVVEAALLALRDDATVLPSDLHRLFGPLRPPTYEAAARMLLWARHAPSGPRCVSYRSALYLLQRLEEDDVDPAELRAPAA